MAKQIPIQILGGTTAENDAYTGQQRVITVDLGNANDDPKNLRLRVHDGVTAGGFKLATTIDLLQKSDVSHTHTTFNNDLAISGNLSATGTVTAPSFVGDLTGTATKVGHALKLQKADNTSVTFDGSASYDLTEGVYYAATAGVTNKLGTTDIGSSTKLFYLSSGVATESSATVGSATKPVYLSSGVITEGDQLKALAYKDGLTAAEVGAIAIAAKGVASGVAELDSTGKVPTSQLPSYVDDVIDGYYYDHKFYKTKIPGDPPTYQDEIAGEPGKIYVDVDTNKTYRWGGTTVGFVVIASDLALGETESTAYRGDRGKIAYDHSQSTHARTDATKVEHSDTNGNIKIDGTENTVYTHPSITVSGTTSTASPDHGGTFTAIDEVTVNSDGHVTAYNTKTVTLPAQYVLPTASSTLGGVKTTSTVTDVSDYIPVPIVDGVPYYKNTESGTTYNRLNYILSSDSKPTYTIPSDFSAIQVYMDGTLTLEGPDENTGTFHVSGRDVIFNDVLPKDTEISIVYYASFDVGTLPTASATVLGVVKIGTGIDVTSDGVISATGGQWGSITGTLANQADLKSALDAKLAIADLPDVNNVTQTNVSDNSDFRLLLSGSANDTTESTTTKKSANFKANPSTGDLTITGSFNAGKIFTENGPVVGVTLVSTSDERLKTDIESVDRDLSNLQAKRYTLKQDGKQHIGLIAQDVIKVVPEAIYVNDNGFYAMDYNAIVALLVNKVNQLEAKINSMEKK